MSTNYSLATCNARSCIKSCNLGFICEELMMYESHIKNKGAITPTTQQKFKTESKQNKRTLGAIS